MADRSACLHRRRFVITAVYCVSFLTTIAANLLSDTLLVAIPLRKLWRVRLPKEQRRLILGAFAASATTSTATLACSIFQFAPEKWEPAKTELREKLSYFEVFPLPHLCLQGR